MQKRYFVKDIFVGEGYFAFLLYHKNLLLDFFLENSYIIYGFEREERRGGYMAKKTNMTFASVTFDRVFFDPHFGSYTFRLTSTEKSQKVALHIPIQGSSEEIMGIPFLLTDPLLRNLFKTLRIKVENISLYQSEGLWRGKVEMRWGWWKKRLDIRPLDAIRFSVEFHKPILVPSEMLRPVVMEKEKEEKKQAYKILFMPKPMRRGEVPYEEIM